MIWTLKREMKRPCVLSPISKKSCIMWTLLGTVKLSVASLPCKMNWIFCSRDCQPQLGVHVGDWLQTTAPHKTQASSLLRNLASWKQHHIHIKSAIQNCYSFQVGTKWVVPYITSCDFLSFHVSGQVSNQGLWTQNVDCSSGCWSMMTFSNLWKPQLWTSVQYQVSPTWKMIQDAKCTWAPFLQTLLRTSGIILSMYRPRPCGPGSSKLESNQKLEFK